MSLVGGAYFSEKQFEETHTCKMLWVLGNLMQKKRFEDLPEVFLENPSLRRAMDFAASRDMNLHEERVDAFAGAKAIGPPTHPPPPHPTPPTPMLPLLLALYSLSSLPPQLNSQAKQPR